jgi:hypothetical protein
VNKTVSHTAVAAAALAAGASGTAVGAQLITGKTVKDGSLGVKDLSKKARRALKGNSGKRGLHGLPGLQGLQGIQGIQGAAGGAGGSLLFGSGPLASGTEYLRIGGDGTNGTESGVQVPLPRGGTVRNLQVHLDFNPISTRTFTLNKNGGATALTCPIAGPAVSCSSAGSTAVAAGDLLSMQEVSSGKVAPNVASFGFELAP